MLSRLAISWAILASLFGFVLGGSFVWVLLPPPQTQQESASQQKPGDKPAEHNPLKRFWNWTTHDPVGFYTFVLAIFTGVLGSVSIFQAVMLLRADKTTRIAADAAMLSARAAIGIELPIIRCVERPGLIGDSRKPLAGARFPGGIHAHDIQVGFYWITTPNFRNLGRTTAFPSAIKIGWHISAAIPLVPNYQAEDVLGPTSVILPDSDFGAPDRTFVEITQEDYAAIKAGSCLWLYAALFYSDFLNNRHEARFCWKFANGFGPVPDAPQAYTRHT